MAFYQQYFYLRIFLTVMDSAISVYSYMTYNLLHNQNTLVTTEPGMTFCSIFPTFFLSYMLTIIYYNILQHFCRHFTNDGRNLQQLISNDASSTSTKGTTSTSSFHPLTPLPTHLLNPKLLLDPYIHVHVCTHGLGSLCRQEKYTQTYTLPGMLG